MKINGFISHATSRLKAAGITTARLDCLVLLEDILNTNRTQILAHPEREITEAECSKLDKLIEKRSRHMPLAYVRGKTEFYGREFMINTHVLEPRPESETMLDLLAKISPEPHTIVDVGTGSGALAITAKRLVPGANVLAIDIDVKCLQLAKRNAKNLSADVTFLSGDLLEPLETYTMNTPIALLCNLPYVPDNFQINQAATHEPRIALFGGPDGLDPYRHLFEQLVRTDTTPSYILTESLPPQHDQLAAIAKEYGYQQAQEQDFIQSFVPDA